MQQHDITFEKVSKLVKISNDTYRGYVYLDLVQDENYYGLGICHWVVNETYLTMKVHGVTFVSSIQRKDILTQSIAPTFFSKEHYFGVPIKGIVDSSATYENYSKMPDKSKYFYVTGVAKEVTS